MGFTTNTFLFLFLPITVLLYFIFYHYMKKRNRYTAGNIVIAAASYIFYAWASETNAIMLFLYTIIVYVLGKIIYSGGHTCINIGYDIDCEETKRRIKMSTLILVLGLFFSVYSLYHFKYMPTIASVISKFYFIDENKYSNIIVPLGISFITFSSISYLVDIYEGKATPGSFLDCILYVYYFPKIVSGPVVEWKEFEPQINHHPTTTEDFVYGINRIIIGFAKKVILADTFGAFLNTINGIEIDRIAACMGWLAYALQIYYDFSGYSDIAIGLSRVFGIRFEENFNFPYRSLSVTEFWRRWHISLGRFFKDYIYIPLGGNRKGYRQTLINLAVVFVVTGIWHGAGSAYIIWGSIHGICVIVERMIREKTWYHRIPKAVKGVFTFVFVASLWQLFRFGDLQNTLDCFGQMTGINSNATIRNTWEYYSNNRLVTFFLVGLVGSTFLGSQKLWDFYIKIRDIYVFYILQEVFLFGLLIMSIAFMINSTYSPFIYFQF